MTAHGLPVLAAAVLALAAAGCVTPPAPPPGEPTVEVPDRWSAADGSDGFRLSPFWWEEFGDPLLDDLVKEALARNPVLVEAASRIDQAAARARIAGADLSPHVRASADGTVAMVYAGKSELAPNTVRAESFGVGLNVSWELDLWSRIRSGQLAAFEGVKAERAFHDGVRLSLAAQTAKAYFAAVEAANQLEVARSQLASAEDLSGRIDERFQRGLRQALDLKLAETEVSRAAALVAIRRRALDAAFRQLETLAGRYPSAEVLTASRLPALPGPVPAGVPAEVLARRPDLAAAQNRVAATGYQQDAAEADLYPRISLTGSGGLSSEDLGDLLKGDFGVWSLGANILQPIFEGDRIRATIDLREAEWREAAAAFASGVLVAFREVETGLAAERYLDGEVAALERLVTEAGASLSLSDERYLQGLVDILAVLEARRRDFGARSELLRANFEQLTNRVDLIVALGGGTTPPPAASPERSTVD